MSSRETARVITEIMVNSRMDARINALTELKSELEESITVVVPDGYEKEEQIQQAFNEGIQSAINIINKKLENQ